VPVHVSSTMCSSSGGQNCIIQHLVSPHSVGDRPVHGTDTRFCASSWLITKAPFVFVTRWKWRLGAETCRRFL